jgi:hypothetical protein
MIYAIGGKANTSTHMCNCIGPQPGHTLCPCMWRVEQEKERLLKERLIADGWTPPESRTGREG